MNNNNNDKDLWKLKLLMIVGYWAIMIILVILGDYINKRYIYIYIIIIINKWYYHHNHGYNNTSNIGQS